MARKMNLDFTGVESFKRASEGDHVCKIVSADVKQSQGGNDMIVVAFEVTKGEDRTARVYENYPLVDTALWKLKSLLQAIGMSANGKVRLDLDKLIGKVVIVTVKHEEWEGKTRARVEEVKKFSTATAEDEDGAEDDIDDEEEDEEPEEKPTKKSSKKAPMNPPEDDDDDWDDEEEEEEKPSPKTKKSKKTEKAKKPAPKKDSEDEEDDDWDDDDWDEE